jgi:hypothetical protein
VYIPPAPNAPFAPEEYAPFKAEGTATVSGQAFLKTRGGDVKYAAGNPVYLIPSTEYTRQLTSAQTAAGPRDLIVRLDARMNYRQTTADGEGRFSFEALPAGDYFVLTYAIWEVPSPDAWGLTRTGGWVRALVRVRASSQIKNVVVTEVVSDNQ